MSELSVERTVYLRRLMDCRGTPVIKTLVGMRRVGKSVLLRQFADALVRADRRAKVALVDKELVEFDAIRTYRDLHAHALRVLGKARGYKALLVDEVQEIEGWEKALASLLKRGDIDLYVTGSNAHLHSSELATLIAGRYVQVPVHSLGFAEFLDFRGVSRTGPEVQTEFDLYLRLGGLPAVHQFAPDSTTLPQYLRSIFATIILKDIVSRHEVRDVPTLERIARFVFANVGNIVSAKRIADFLSSQHLRVGMATVQSYLSYLADALVVHKTQRYDLKGKRILELLEKYYLEDFGVRNALIGYRQSDISGLLENVVFLELLRRGYDVKVGKVGETEIDFVAEKGPHVLRIQVAYLLHEKATIERELAPLRALRDNYPKYVLSMDTAPITDFDGIRRLPIIEFLLGDRWEAL